MLLAGPDVQVDLLIGAELIEASALQAAASEAELLRAWARRLREPGDATGRAGRSGGPAHRRGADRGFRSPGSGIGGGAPASLGPAAAGAGRCYWPGRTFRWTCSSARS